MGVMKKDHWQLTPHPARNCWKKKRDGQTHYVGYGSVRYNEAEYQRAWDEWEKKLADIEAAERAERKADAIPRILEIVDNNERPDPDELNRIGWPLEPRLAAILRRQRDENDKTLRPDELAYMMEQFHKRADAADAAGKGKRPPTLNDLADLFLNRRAAQAR